MSPTVARRRGIRRTRLLSFVVAALLVGAVTARGQREPASPLAEATRVLEQQVSLASGKDFYLVLEPSRSAMTLFLKGATLQQYHVEGLEVGRRRWAYFTRPGASDWAGVVWRGGTLEPERLVPRVEIGPGADATVPPPLPEDHIAVPPAYRLRFADGLVVEVWPAGPGAQSGWGGLARRATLWWSDFRAALWGTAAGRVRLRLTLSESDAESLYRALPPDTALLIVPPGVDLSRSEPARGARSRS